MIQLIRDLFAHQAWADSALLGAIRKHQPACDDPEVRTLAYHIVMVQQFFLTQSQGLPFSREQAAVVPQNLDDIIAAFRDTHAAHASWLTSVTDGDLSRKFSMSAFQNREITVADALTQTCLHSQGHRSQLAMLLRKMGGSPPVLDYILWTVGRPAPQWE